MALASSTHLFRVDGCCKILLFLLSFLRFCWWWWKWWQQKMLKWKGIRRPLFQTTFISCFLALNMENGKEWWLITLSWSNKRFYYVDLPRELDCGQWVGDDLIELRCNLVIRSLFVNIRSPYKSPEDHVAYLGSPLWWDSLKLIDHRYIVT